MILNRTESICNKISKPQRNIFKSYNFSDLVNNFPEREYKVMLLGFKVLGAKQMNITNNLCNWICEHISPKKTYYIEVFP